MDEIAIMKERLENAEGTAAEAKGKGYEISTIVDIARAVGIDEALCSNPAFIYKFEIMLGLMDFESKKGQQAPSNAPLAYTSIQHFGTKFTPSLADTVFSREEMDHAVSLIKDSGRFATPEECVDYMDQNKTSDSVSNNTRTSMVINEDGMVSVQRVFPATSYRGPDNDLGFVVYDTFSVDEKGNMIIKKNGFTQKSKDSRIASTEQIETYNPDGYSVKQDMTM